MTYIEDRSIPEPNTGCWLWLGSVGSHGYGTVTYDRESKTAPRLSYELTTGRSVPKGMVLRHICNTRLCVNPKHLCVGTRADNAQDAVKAGVTRSEKNMLGRAMQRVYNDTTIKKIRELETKGLNYRQIAETLNLAARSVRSYVHPSQANYNYGRNW